MGDEPIAQGALLLVGAPEGPLAQLAKEAAHILLALKAPGAIVERASEGADYVLLILADGANARDVPLPDLKDRAGSAVAVADDAAAGRAAITLARKHLRAHGAALGPHELVFTTTQFGYLGLETDSARERLEILLHTLVVDAERLRLRREGWEEPETR